MEVIKEQLITDERIEKFKRSASNRQELTIILENVHDPHNIGAVMRSCDIVGVHEIFVVYTDENLDYENLEVGTKSASSAKKWVQVHFFEDWESCNAEVKKRYDHIYATHLSKESKSIYNMDLTTRIALLFGNEKDGISDEAFKYVDQNILIPQYGLVQSLNISVACAVTLFESLRQRQAKGKYDAIFDENNESHKSSYDYFVQQHTKRYFNK